MEKIVNDLWLFSLEEACEERFFVGLYLVGFSTICIFLRMMARFAVVKNKKAPGQKAGAFAIALVVAVVNDSRDSGFPWSVEIYTNFS